MIFVFSIILFNFRVVPSKDALNVQDTAMYLAKSQIKPLDLGAPHVRYFGRVSNNYFLTILYVQFFKFLMNIGISDIYFPLHFVAVTGVMIAVVFMYLTCVKLGGLRMGAKMLLLCVLNPVYYILVLWVYTNVMSLPFTMAVIYFGLCIYKAKTKKGCVIACILESVSAILGYFIRATALIPVIAFIVCAIIWMMGNKQRMLKIFKCVMICAVVAVLLFKSVSTLNESYFSTVSGTTFPFTHWLMMGSHGTGQYKAADFDYTEKFETKEEKTKVTVQQTINNYRKFSLSEFLAFQNKKLNVTWCLGDGGDLITKVAQDRRQTKLYSWILGDRADLFRLYCYAFRIANIFFVIIALCWFLRRRELNIGMFLFTLTFLGGILFHCIWEVKGSYASPFIYVMLFLGMQGACILKDRMFSNGDTVQMKTGLFSVLTGLMIVLCVCLVTYNGMTQTKVTLRDWSVRCYGNQSVKDIISDENEMIISQEFYIEKPVNQFVLSGWADDEARKNNLSYQVRILASDKEELYSGTIKATDIKSNGVILIKTGEIIPKGRECYTIRLVKNKESGGKMFIKQRNSDYVDTYDGILSVNGQTYVNDLYLQVYREYKSNWCSKAKGIFINGAIFSFVLFTLLGIWGSARLQFNTLNESDSC